MRYSKFDPDYEHHFTRNAAWFMTAHPHCRIGIRDEYDDTYPIEEGA